MNRKLVDVWVGLFVIAGFAAVLMLALKAGNLASFNFSETYQVNAKFDNIGGLKARAAVKSAGVVVGRVANISFDDQTYEAIVTLAMERKYNFPKDTSAKILTAGLLGEQYIGLEAGGDNAKLADGGKIKVTQSAIVLENLISQFLYSKAADGKPAEGGTPGGAPGGGSTGGTGSTSGTSGASSGGAKATTDNSGTKDNK